MNGSLASIIPLVNGVTQGAAELQSVDIVLCPSFPYLSAVQEKLANSDVLLGAQNMSAQMPGAFTGEVSAEMLRDFQCHSVIIGHSERRSLYAESDVQVADKVVHALAEGFSPILCVGESLEERESGDTEKVVGRQLQAVLEKLNKAQLNNMVIAYEPVWAIGTGKTASSEQAQEVHAFIRKMIADFAGGEIAQGLRILYGGSVKPGNAKELFAMTDIDGGLIGGAALVAEDFLSICRASQ